MKKVADLNLNVRTWATTIEYLLLAAFLVLIIAIMTWPMMSKPTTTLPGSYWSDSASSIDYYGEIVREKLNPFIDSKFLDAGLPEGGEINLLEARSAPLSTITLLALTHFVGSTLAHNLVIIVSLFLTGLMGYYFIRQLSRSYFVALFGGSTLITGQYVFDRISSVPIYSAHFIFVAIIGGFSTWYLSNKIPFYLYLAIAVGLLWTPYYALHVVLLLFVLLVPSYFFRKTAFSTIFRRIAAVVTPLLGYLFLVRQMSPTTGLPMRNQAEFAQFALHPLRLLIPGNMSTLWGDGFNKYFVDQGIPAPTGGNTYLGWSLVTLLLVGGLMIWHQPVHENGRLNLVKNLCTSFVLLLLFAGPPRYKFIPTPSWLIEQFAPEFRWGAYVIAPIGIIFIFITCVVWGTLIRDKRTALQVIFAIVVIPISILDTWSRPPAGSPYFTRDVPSSESLYELSTMPKGLTLHLPWGVDTAGFACRFREYHNMPIVNSCSGVLSQVQVELKRRGPVDRLSYLREIGVRYVIIDGNGLSASFYEVLSQDDSARLLFSDEMRSVWSI